MTDGSYQNFKTSRDALNVTSGDELVGRLGGDRLVLESRWSRLERLQNRYAEVEGSLADERIAERREGAGRE